MKILLTGASSFTGRWFAVALAEAGHAVHAVFTRSGIASYSDEMRRERVASVLEMCEPVFDCRFGDKRFLSLLRNEAFDLLCHHAADVTDYRSEDFDVCSAVANNAYQARAALTAFAERSSGALLLTGSVFEGGEGVGSDGVPHFSPYGLSKSLTAQLFEYHCRSLGVVGGKFVIPNPFGPWEEPRFTAYLIRTWAAGDVPTIRTPDYVRDNIHVSLLARSYVNFAERLVAAPARNEFIRRSPSGYVETQGAFAERLASEMRMRLNWNCPVQHARQTEFNEPRVRINTEPAATAFPDWSEAAAWDEMASFYQRQHDRASALKLAAR